MATITDHASANSTSSGATLSLTGVTAAVGDWLILACAADNSGASGVSSTSASITDAAGNTWTSRSQVNYTPGGAADDGTTLRIWTCAVTSALSSATVTINFSPNTASKAAILKKIVPAAGETIEFVGVDATGTTVTGTALDAPTVSVAQGQTIFGFGTLESNGPGTADSDTTNGSWSSDYNSSASTGTAATSQAIGGQHKTVTATGNQTYGRSGNNRDRAANYIILGYVSSGSAAGTSTVSGEPKIAGATAGVGAASGVPKILGTAAGIGAALGVPTLEDIVIAWAAITEAPDRVAGRIAPGWPDRLPAPTLNGYSFAAAASVKRLAVDIGAARVYRRTRQPVVEVGVVWIMNATQMRLFDGLQRTILREGAEWFSAELAFPAGLKTAVARIKEKLAIRSLGGDIWQASGALELLQRPMLTDDELTALIGSGTDWPTILPAPTRGSWELTPKPALARSEDLPGYPQARHRSFASVADVPTAWELDALQASVFDAFFHHRARDGAAWFDFPVVQAIATTTTAVRFTGEANWTPRGNGRWSVSAPIEIRERRVYTTAQYTTELRGA